MLAEREVRVGCCLWWMLYIVDCGFVYHVADPIHSGGSIGEEK